MTTTEPTDAPSATAPAGAPAPRRRRWPLLTAAAVTLAAAAAVVAYATRDTELRQTLCGLPRADDTALGLVLPRDSPGVEARTLSDDSLGGHGKLSCVISVDGHEVVRILLYAVDPDRPTGTGISIGAGDLVTTGVITGPGSASVTAPCPDTQALVATALVTTDPTLWPKPTEDQTPTNLALGDLATTVLAQQRQQICH
ncbi:hypothetical protein OH807_35415 [Kitasatospora sp. NBC_01560]|uniref:hypothetical protein n=1 Tax=Kitasatospora sp. NBC_01560 TaxID=2975965 RepID=UPI00386B4E41